MCSMALLFRLVWWCRVGVLLVGGPRGLLVRLGRGMVLKGLRGVWLGRGIELLGGLERGWWAFFSLWFRFLGFVIPPPPNATFHVVFMRYRFVIPIEYLLWQTQTVRMLFLYTCC